MVARCNGHVSITDEGLSFIGKGNEDERSITLIYRLFVLGNILDNNIGNTKKNVNESYANSNHDLKRNTLYLNFLQDEPPPNTKSGKATTPPNTKDETIGNMDEVRGE